MSEYLVNVEQERIMGLCGFVFLMNFDILTIMKGFLASGIVLDSDNQKIHYELIIDDDLNITMRKFRELETVKLETPKSHEAKIAEEPFVQTHFRESSGKYLVSIPLKEEPVA
ncbi:hypothetical protein NPIL_21451 [Nephila pilipes]|uniref:Uncharacterized protein n=1 Tax=Nephila pilipes TaxID=299642 RepID=A0A8X6PZJ4_NEPPI|nr:hypothetical protein NPIL_21451 [Nephila pilipes]